jgi:hypothetical protein
MEIAKERNMPQLHQWLQKRGKSRKPKRHQRKKSINDLKVLT